MAYLRALTGTDFRGFDCVELSPLYDPTGITAWLAASACHEMLSLRAAARVRGHWLGAGPDADPLWPRWPWSVEVEPLLAVPLVSNAPPVEALGIPPRSMSQQSHIRLMPERYARAVEAIASVAGS